MRSASGAGHRGEVALVAAPPAWAVAVVKCCLVGILVWPVVAPLLLLAGSAFLGVRAEHFRSVATPGLIGVWLFMLGMAHTLTTHYPPVPPA